MTERRFQPDLQVTRLPERQVRDRRVLEEILDEGLVAHVGLVREDLPVVLPLGYARSGDDLLLHGSTGGGLLREAVQGAPLSVTVTLLDALVFARSLFDSSMNYRSAMVRGVAEAVEGEAKVLALRSISEHLMPGRWDEVRPPTGRELAATLVLRLPLEQASVKVRAGGPGHLDGEDPKVWAGVLPLATVPKAPLAGSENAPGVDAPASVTRWPGPRRRTR